VPIDNSLIIRELAFRICPSTWLRAVSRSNRFEFRDSNFGFKTATLNYPLPWINQSRAFGLAFFTAARLLPPQKPYPHRSGTCSPDGLPGIRVLSRGCTQQAPERPCSLGSTVRWLSNSWIRKQQPAERSGLPPHQTGIIGNKKTASFDQCHGVTELGSSGKIDGFVPHTPGNIFPERPVFRSAENENAST
jgi:hypothetical protein